MHFPAFHLRAIDDSVWVEHGDDLEYESLPETLGHWVVAAQKFQGALHHPAGIRLTRMNTACQHDAGTITCRQTYTDLIICLSISWSVITLSNIASSSFSGIIPVKSALPRLLFSTHYTASPTLYLMFTCFVFSGWVGSRSARHHSIIPIRSLIKAVLMVCPLHASQQSNRLRQR